MGALATIAAMAGGCGSLTSNNGVNNGIDSQSVQARAVSPQTTAKTQTLPPANTGLQLLPKPSHVVTKIPIGKQDPFTFRTAVSPLPRPPADIVIKARPVLSQEQIKELIKDVKIEGFISNGSHQVIVVEYLKQKGDVYLGQTGGSSSVYLPRGWTFSQLDTQRGRVLLTNASKNLRAYINL